MTERGRSRRFWRVLCCCDLSSPGASGAGPARLFVRGRAESRRVWLAIVEPELLVRLPLIFCAVPTSEAVGRLRYRFGYRRV